MPAILPQRVEGTEDRTVRDVAEAVTAALAPRIGEIHHLATVLAVEDLHREARSAGIVQQRGFQRNAVHAGLGEISSP
jgi:hypothetical protein